MEEGKVKKNKSTEKDVINVIRTTQRNNIELTHIADNKANVLLSLNALMITIILPYVLTNIDSIFDKNLGIPLLILTLTNVITIYLSTIVLKPGDFENFKNFNLDKGRYFSPFFFGNYFKMEREEFSPYMQEALENGQNIKQFLADDLFYIGKRLGKKMTIIRNAFNIFIAGISISLLTTIIVVIIN